MMVVAGGWATAPDGPYAWGLCFKDEINPQSNYCDATNKKWPCYPGKSYNGRGPIQLSWYDKPINSHSDSIRIRNMKFAEHHSVQFFIDKYGIILIILIAAWKGYKLKFIKLSIGSPELICYIT